MGRCIAILSIHRLDKLFLYAFRSARDCLPSHNKVHAEALVFPLSLIIGSTISFNIDDRLRAHLLLLSGSSP
jgi:hypothetical protein